MSIPSRIVQQWCSCGSGVVGDIDEEPFVQDFITHHPPTCPDGHLIDDQPMQVSYGTPCGLRLYGYTSSDAAQMFNDHLLACDQCRN